MQAFVRWTSRGARLTHVVHEDDLHRRKAWPTTRTRRRSKHLLTEALEYAEFSRRSLLTGATALGAGALGGGLIGTADADEIRVAQATGKKVRVGVPLTYGPFNQPWRRGCWQVVKTLPR